MPSEGEIQTPDGASRHIAIVGAGVSGLRCADILLQKGFKVTILEARNRIGGRVCQRQLYGHLVDLGPNWFHGSESNPILGLAAQTETVYGGGGKSLAVFNEHGHALTPTESEKYFSLMWSIIKDAFVESRENYADISPSQSLYDYFEKRVHDKVPLTEANYEETRRIVLQLSETWASFVGGSVYRQSMKYFWMEECVNKDNLFCDGTFAKILLEIAKPALAGAEIRLGAKVEKITYQNSTAGKIGVQVKGRTLSFDDVVVTAPLGWLKRNQDVFEPALPKPLAMAIESIGYGCLEKVKIAEIVPLL